MLVKRIIPCLDIKDGRTVKGVRFLSLKDAGDPVELATRYCEEGADELIFLDITASVEKRQTLVEVVRKVAGVIDIPFTVGGGIRSLDDVRTLLYTGADKVSVNSVAVSRPELITDIANEFGSQCAVVAIDAKFMESDWKVFIKGGREETPLSVLSWAKEVVERGAGEILLTSMDHDGAKSGFANDLLAHIASSVGVPLIASGGAGSQEDFLKVFTEGKADAALAASVFHFNEIPIRSLKSYLAKNGIPVREMH